MRARTASEAGGRERAERAASNEEETMESEPAGSDILSGGGEGVEEANDEGAILRTRLRTETTGTKPRISPSVTPSRLQTNYPTVPLNKDRNKKYAMKFLSWAICVTDWCVDGRRPKKIDRK
jgi:hypothetical protein